MEFFPTQQFKVVVSDQYQYTGYIVPQELGRNLVVSVYKEIFREIIQDRENQYHTENPKWSFRYYNLVAVLLNPCVLEPQGTPMVSDEIPYVIDPSQNKGEWQRYIRVP